VRYLRSLSFVQGTCVNLLRTSILFLMLYLIFTQRITVGQFFSLFIYSFFIFGPLQELGNVINVYRGNRSVAGELRGDPQAAGSTQSRTSGADRIARDAAFRRGDVPTPVRFDAGHSRNLIPRDQGRDHRFRRALRGGKTTLVKLLVGLYRPKGGHIYYNGTSEDEIAIEDLREKLGFVTQDAQLFSGSIRENLQFVHPNATDENAWRSCAIVFAEPAGGERIGVSTL